jgi:two-component system cell cycle response regulator DivK
MTSNIPPDLLNGWIILIIDDEPDSLELARYILNFYGADVHTAVNGEHGLAMVQEIRPRFVISDLSMPEVDGWGFLSQLRELDSDVAQTPVIALTAHAMRGDKERAVEAGFHSYLTKPLTARTFMDELLRLLLDIPELSEYLAI